MATKIKIFNHGPHSVPKSDFETPIIIKPINNTFFIQSTILNNTESIKPNIITNDSNQLIIEPVTLKKDEYIEVNLLIANDNTYLNQAPFQIETRIAQNKDFTLSYGVPQSTLSKFIRFFEIPVLLILSLIAFIFFTFLWYEICSNFYSYRLKREKNKTLSIVENNINLNNIFSKSMTSPNAVEKLIGIIYKNVDIEIRTTAVNMLCYLITSHYVHRSRAHVIISDLIKLFNSTEEIELNRSILFAIKMLQIDGRNIDLEQLKNIDDAIVNWLLNYIKTEKKYL